MNHFDRGNEEPGQVDGKHASGAREVVRVDLASVRFSAPSAEGETKTHAGSIGAALLERAEELVDIPTRQTSALVLNLDEHSLGAGANSEHDRRPGPCELEGVVQQVSHDRGQDLAIGLNRHAVFDGHYGQTDPTGVGIQCRSRCDFLDESFSPRLHPDEAFQRARERAWVAFGSALLDAIAGFYSAPDEALQAKRADIASRFATLEAALDARGPWFAGERFGMVDAVFGPIFRYFDAFERIDDFAFFEGLVRVPAWRVALRGRPSVRAAVDEGYPERLWDFLRRRGSALSWRMTTTEAAA